MLAIKAVSTNQTFNQQQNATDFKLNNVSDLSLGSEADTESEGSVDAGDSHSESETPEEVVEDSVRLEGVPGAEDLAPIHPGDVSRSKRLSMILNTLKNLPHHKKTLILGHSNAHGVKGGNVDPDNDTVAVRSFSGLCIVAAFNALQKHKFS